MQDALLNNPEILEILKTISIEGIRNAALGFSGMVGHSIEVNNPVASLVPLFQISKIMGGPENEAVGIYLRFDGDLDGQIMMVIPYQKSLGLVDLLMGNPSGTTQTLEHMELSALGELGNMCGSFFLNALAKIIGASFRPTPPAVMVDMVGAILDIIIASTGGLTENILLIQAVFMEGERSVETDFWVVPDLNTLAALVKRNYKV